jgi:RNA polymerase sigma-70 factor, ECF subfamily
MDTTALLQRVLNGETDAYAQIVAKHQTAVWRVVIAILHNHELSREIVEQSFVEAYLSLDQFKSDGDFELWVKGIARNLIREELRRKTRESKRLEVYKEHVLARLDAPEEQAVAQTELQTSLKRCREKLPGNSARVLDMRYSEGKGFDEIASDIGRTVEATRQLLQRTRATLKDCIDRSMAQA